MMKAMAFWITNIVNDFRVPSNGLTAILLPLQLPYSDGFHTLAEYWGLSVRPLRKSQRTLLEKKHLPRLSTSSLLKLLKMPPRLAIMTTLGRLRRTGRNFILPSARIGVRLQETVIDVDLLKLNLLSSSRICCKVCTPISGNLYPNSLLDVMFAIK